ncbi:MAG TPA: DUF1508 domain-containing protein [Gemmata sp.]|jgi:uncharacterized protein YegP (UPF0339 family)|nr:DUF1508 domain-containing protein [Gemmata sp.]
MGKILRAVVLFAAIAGLMTAVGSAIAPAQVKDKDKDKDKDKKDTKAAPEEIGVTEVYKATDGWRFRIKSPDGKSLAIGTVMFDKKEDCLKAVEVVKTALLKGKVVELKDEKK